MISKFSGQSICFSSLIIVQSLDLRHLLNSITKGWLFLLIVLVFIMRTSQGVRLILVIVFNVFVLVPSFISSKKKAKRRKPIALLGIEPNSTLIPTSLADCYSDLLVCHETPRIRRRIADIAASLYVVSISLITVPNLFLSSSWVIDDYYN